MGARFRRRMAPGANLPSVSDGQVGSVCRGEFHTRLILALDETASDGMRYN